MQLLDAVVGAVGHVVVLRAVGAHDALVHGLERLPHVRPLLGARQHHLARAEDEHDHLLEPHDEPGEHLGLVRAVRLPVRVHLLQVDAAIALARGHDVLDAEALHAHARVDVPPQDGRVAPAGQQRVILTHRAGDH